MTDFRHTPRPRNYLARREQWRLLLLVASLGLVVLAMNEARKPANWAWLLGRGGDRPAPASPADDSAPLDSVSLDGVPLDVPTDAGPQGEEASDQAVLPAAEQAETTSDGRYFPGVVPKWFDSVRDDTTFRPEEHDAWFGLLGILDRTDPARLERASIGQVTFTQLYRQSPQYRGRLVTVCGTIRRVVLKQAPQNDRGIRRYYQTVLQPAEDPSELVFVYCLSLPEGFPTGDEVSAEVEATGFFYKRWAYRAQEELLSRPVVLARTVRWNRPPPATGRQSADGGHLIALIGFALAATGLVIVYVYRRTRRRRRAEPAEPPRFNF